MGTVVAAKGNIRHGSDSIYQCTKLKFSEY